MYNITNGIDIITVSDVSYSIPTGFYSAYGIADALASLGMAWPGHGPGTGPVALRLS
jgi:hypothetical protein